MLALVKFAKGPGNLEGKEVPRPTIGDNDILMKVYAKGFCGKDIEYNGIDKLLCTFPFSSWR